MDSGILWQRVEGLLLFLAGLAIYWSDSNALTWWAALLIFWLPDLSFAAYVYGPKFGSFIYNLFHVYALGAILIALGHIFSNQIFVVIGGLWLGHSGFDRMLGYGLKLPDSFRSTSLGMIGKRLKE